MRVLIERNKHGNLACWEMDTDNEVFLFSHSKKDCDTWIFDADPLTPSEQELCLKHFFRGSGIVVDCDKVPSLEEAKAMLEKHEGENK